MPAPSKSNTWNAYESFLTAPLGAGATTVAVDNTDNLVAPMYIVIDPDDPVKREWVRITAVSAGSIDNMDRGLAGSVGTEHDANGT